MGSEAAGGANGQYVSSAAERSNQAKWSYDYLQQLLADEYINVPERSRVYVKDAAAATSESSSGHSETRWIIAKGIYVLYRATTASVNLTGAPVYPAKWTATQHANDDADDFAKVVKGVCPAAADASSLKLRRRLRAGRV